MPLIATLTLNPAMDLSVSTPRVISTESCGVRCRATTRVAAGSTWRGW